MSDEIRVPDAIEPIVAYRGWRLGEGRLLSTAASAIPWEPGDNEALCFAPHHRIHEVLRNTPDGPVADTIGEHGRIPDEKCQCGFWSLKTLADAYARLGDSIGPPGFGGGLFGPRGPVVYGELEIWGRIIKAEKGYRSEFARITKLFYLEGHGGSTQMHQLARFYNVPLEGSAELGTHEDASYHSSLHSGWTSAAAGDVHYFGAPVQSRSFWQDIRIPLLIGSVVASATSVALTWFA